jgi:hypothetical protein
LSQKTAVDMLNRRVAPAGGRVADVEVGDTVAATEDDA